MVCPAWVLKKAALFVAIIGCGLLGASPASGQTGTTSGVLLGTVSDATGAVVPEASVTVTSERTGLQRQAVTDTSGNFRFGLLPPGPYKLRVVRTGFMETTSDLIQVEVGVERRVNFTVQVEGVATQVAVSATVATINTTNAEVGEVIQGKQITDLPLNFREFTQLALLAPGATLDVRERIFPGRSNITINGQNSQYGNVMIDGIDSGEPVWGGTSMSFLNLDSIQEFKVTTSNYSAELAGSSYNIRAVIKSGSNKLHGTAYEFLGNDALAAREFFDRNDVDASGKEIPGTAKTPYRRNQFGGTAGGPVIKDKLFWFLSYEGLRQTRGLTSFASVPTADQRKGIVNAINPVTNLPDTLFVPVDPSIASLINRYALPNFPSGPYRENTVKGQASASFRNDQYIAKLDWQKSAKDTFSASWAYYNQPGPHNPNIAQAGGYGNHYYTTSRHLTLSNLHTFSSRLVNEVRLGYHRETDFFQNDNMAESPLVLQDGAFSTLNSGALGYGQTGHMYSFDDSISYLRGRHSIKTGFQLKQNRTGEAEPLFDPVWYYYAPGPIVKDVPTASGVTIPAGSVGSSIVNFLEAAPSFSQVGGPRQGFPPQGYTRVDRTNPVVYFQDDLKLTPKLTLNLGIRWEYYTRYKFRDSAAWNAVYTGPNTGDIYFNPSGDQFYKAYWGNVNPRAGFAYSISPKTVLRSGFAIFTIPGMARYLEGSHIWFPSMQVQFIGVPAAWRQGGYVTRRFTWPALYDVNGDPLLPGGSKENRLIDSKRYFNETGTYMGAGATSPGLDPNYRQGSLQNWNLTLERELGLGMMVSSAYVGSAGEHLEQFSRPWCQDSVATNAECVAAQQAWHAKGTVAPNFTDNGAHSSYHSLQVSLKRSYERGIAFQASYAFGKILDNYNTNNTAAAGSFTNGGINPFNYSLEKGRDHMDARHVFTFNGMYEPPFSKWWLDGPRRLTEGWQFQTLVNLRTGLPFYITDSSLDSGFGTANRPSVLMPYNEIPRGTSIDKTLYFAPEVISSASKACSDPTAKYFCRTVGGPGSVGRGVFTDAPLHYITFSIIKNTPLTESVNLQFRAEMFNIFNFVNLDIPIGNINNPGFGKYTATVGAHSDPPLSSRQIQFGLKLIF